MSDTFFVTTAIPYVNAKPHIGFALELVQTDCFVRYHRQKRDTVYFLTGSDENALKNVQAAEKEGITPKELVDKYAKDFAGLKTILNISNDDFIRTSEERHFKGAQKLWRSTKKEDIIKKTYRGLYCVGCEQFYTPDELVDGKCPEHQTEPQMVEEENYFFALSKYQQQIEDLITSEKLKIIPDIRKNEILSFIRSGLEDFSISRTVKRAHGWGVPVPDDDGQIMYVWYDALSNYITALDYANVDAKFKQYWLENKNRVHVIGKGITRFHAVYWPAMLMSAGLPVPTMEFVHGYITVDGQKISKSIGNVIDPVDMVNKYGLDALRYYLLREIPSYSDGDFSERRLKEIYNADLANGLGNLVARIARLCETTGINLPEMQISQFSEQVGSVEQFQFDSALHAIWDDITARNRQIDAAKLWEETDTKKDVLLDVVQRIRQIAFDLQPFLPDTAAKIISQYKSSSITSQPPLFPRIK